MFPVETEVSEVFITNVYTLKDTTQSRCKQHKLLCFDQESLMKQIVLT